jgi:hypothetical protein
MLCRIIKLTEDFSRFQFDTKFFRCRIIGIIGGIIGEIIGNNWGQSKINFVKKSKQDNKKIDN